LSALQVSTRYQFTYTLQDAYGSLLFSYTNSTPNLAGRKLALSFAPATASDSATIESYLPQPHADGTPIQASELPKSLPGYLINLTPELTADGQVVASGVPVVMGATLQSLRGYSNSWDGNQLRSKPVVAGEYHAIGLDLAGVSSAQLNALDTKLLQTQSNLQTGVYSNLTKHDVIGDFLQLTIASFFCARAFLI